MEVGRSYAGEGMVSGADNQEEVKVTRKIMIVKPPGYNQGAGSAPASPAGSTPPQSPFSGEVLYMDSDYFGYFILFYIIALCYYVNESCLFFR